MASPRRTVPSSGLTAAQASLPVTISKLADAAPSAKTGRTATGFEVYFLSLDASDDRAARLAAAENAGISAEPAFDQPSGDDVSAILRDMIRTENLSASERLAVAMQARLDLAMNIENRGVKQAPFYVLAGAQMPAVLIEVGFMSNPEEAELLRRSDVQARVVNALFNAILYYDSISAAPGP